MKIKLGRFTTFLLLIFSILGSAQVFANCANMSTRQISAPSSASFAQGSNGTFLWSYNAMSNFSCSTPHYSLVIKNSVGTVVYSQARAQANHESIDGASMAYIRVPGSFSNYPVGNYTVVITYYEPEYDMANSPVRATMGATTTSVSVYSLNTAPSVSNRSLTTNEDQSKSLAFSASDPDAGDFHTYTLLSSPSVGSVSLSGNTLTYYPPANWNGSTSLTYRATDSQGAVSNVATVYITVGPVNDAPSVASRSLTTNEDTAGSLTLTVSDVDLSYEGDSHTWYIVTAPNAAHGTASISGSTLTFTPAPNWSGTTTLTYRVKDSANAYSSAETITVTVNPVNDAPVAQAKSIVTDEDTAGTVTLTATDIDSPVPSVFQVVSGPAQGTASVSGNVLTYTPPANWSGSTSLTYRAQDSGGAWSAPVTVSITVNPINDVPVAQAKSLTAAEDSSGSVTLTVTDPDIAYGDSHTFEIVSAPNTSHGSASISGSTLTFTPVANWNGSTSLTYRAKDEAGAYSAPATVTISITAVNDSPVAEAKSAITDEDVPVSITLTATDIDSPVPTAFQVVAAPNASYGAVSISGSTAAFTPVTNWNGVAVFTYRAQDDQGAWSSAVSVQVTIRAVNDAPVPAGGGIVLKTIEGIPGTARILVIP